MEHRPLGRTGVSVSKLCLGAMMFGDWGNKDHDDSIRIIHRALDAVTVAIIGPRTMEQLESQLPAADVTLSDDVLDRIDGIVTPGTNINPADGGWVSPARLGAGRATALAPSATLTGRAMGRPVTRTAANFVRLQIEATPNGVLFLQDRPSSQ